MILGIDASNIRIGGGLTHLVEVLRAGDPPAHGFDRVVVWSGRRTLDRLEGRPWLVRETAPALDGGLLDRTRWQRRHLSAAARAAGCDVLFVPGGSYGGDFGPMVTFNQNILPFEPAEIRRFGWSSMTLKMWLLRVTQGRTFRRADGVIFLTDYAESVVRKAVGSVPGRTRTIPHGVDPRFFGTPRDPRSIEACSFDHPLRLLYVSPVYPYKHQWHVVDAVGRLRAEGLPVALDLIGQAYHAPSLRRLRAAMARVDPAGAFVTYAGYVEHGDLPARYAAADLFVFASSCESFGQILTEAMAMGLPVACANRSAIPEVVGDAGVYFDPEDPAAIASCLRGLLLDPERRRQLSAGGIEHARRFSWAHCADQTLDLLATCARSGRIPRG